MEWIHSGPVWEFQRCSGSTHARATCWTLFSCGFVPWIDASLFVQQPFDAERWLPWTHPFEQKGFFSLNLSGIDPSLGCFGITKVEPIQLNPCSSRGVEVEDGFARLAPQWFAPRAASPKLPASHKRGAPPSPVSDTAMSMSCLDGCRKPGRRFLMWVFGMWVF